MVTAGTGVPGVTAGVMRGWAGVVENGWVDGVGDEEVHPAARMRAMRRKNIPVPNDFIDCVLCGSVVIGFEGTKFSLDAEYTAGIGLNT